MKKETKQFLKALLIAAIQAIVTAAVGVLFEGGNLLIVVIVVIEIIAFFVLYFYFRGKIDEKDNILKLYKNVGIDGCTEELKDTQFEPRQCMRNVKRSLDFMGVGGNKWVDQDDKLQLFEEMLQRAAASQGKVRYLLIDPRSEGYRKLKELRHNKVPSKSYNQFKELVAKYDCLEVHLYDDLPSFRLQFVDNEYVAVSRYYIEHELHQKKEFGWKIPHLIVRAEKMGDIQKGEAEYQGTLYKSFEQLYQYIWDHSVDIKDVDLTAIN